MMIRSSSAARYQFDRAVRSALLHRGLADVVAIEATRLSGVCRRHRRAVRSEEQAFQEGRGLRASIAGAFARAYLENGVDLIPELAIDDRLVLAGV